MKADTKILAAAEYGAVAKERVRASVSTPPSSMGKIAPFAALFLAVAGIVGLAWRHSNAGSTSTFSTLTTPLAEEELNGEYQLAQESR